MFGNNPGINPLSARKRLLIAESELNRAQLRRDVHGLTTGVRAFTARTATIRSIAASAAGLAAGLTTLKRVKTAKPTRTQMVIKAAGFIASFWLAYRTRGGTR